MRPGARILPMIERIRSLAFRPPLEERAADELAKILDGFVARGEWQVLPAIAALAFSTDPLTADAASIPVANLLHRVPLAELAGLDRSLRQGGWFTDFFTSAWWELRPGALPRGRKKDPTFAPLTRLAMSHPNGRVREAAVRHVFENPQRADLPFLLLRADDWVPIVRGLATAALLPFLVEAHAADVVWILPLYDLVARRWRLDHEVRQAVAQVLASPAGRAALLSGMEGGDPSRRRSVYRHLLNEATSNDRPLLARALADSDTSIRYAALAKVRALGLVAEMGSILRGDPIGIMRSVGLETLPPDSPVQVADYLSDRSARVRHVAQKLLVGRGQDVLERTREVVGRTRGQRLAAALEALAEVARPADAPTARAHFADPSPSVRAAALRVLAGSGDPGSVAAALAALHDPSPRVTRAAASALAKVTPSYLDLERALASMATAHGRADTLRALQAAPYWRQIAVILRAKPSPEVTAALVRWIAKRNRVKQQPTPGELDEARRALGGTRLDPLARAAVAHILG